MTGYRKIIYSWLILVPLVLWSCTKYPPEVPNISPSDYEIPSNATTITFHVKCKGEWQLTLSEKWMTPKHPTPEWEASSKLVGSGDRDIVFEVEENRTFDMRALIATVYSGTNLHKTSVVQYQANIVLEPLEIVFDNNCSTVELNIQAVKPWEILNSGDAPWCQFSQKKGAGYATISLTPDAFTDQTGRKPVDIKFRAGNEVKVLTISHPFTVVSAP